MDIKKSQRNVCEMTAICATYKRYLEIFHEKFVRDDFCREKVEEASELLGSNCFSKRGICSEFRMLAAEE